MFCLLRAVCAKPGHGHCLTRKRGVLDPKHKVLDTAVIFAFNREACLRQAQKFLRRREVSKTRKENLRHPRIKKMAP